MDAATEARIAAIEDAGERERAEQKHQHEVKLRQIEEQSEAYRKANYEAARKAYEAANPGKKYSETDEGGRGWQVVALTNDQRSEIEARVKEENAIYARGVAERYQGELQAMRDYLKEYGTIEEQRYAITKEYDEKIAKEGDAWRRKSLEAEKNSRLSQLNAQSLAADIDWGKTFGGLGTVLQGIAKETIDKIEEYMKSAEFGALSAADKKAYTDLLNEIRSEVGFGASNPFASSTWTNIEQLTQQYQDSVRELVTAQGLHRTAVDNLIAAEEELKNTTEPTARAMAEAKVAIAQGIVQQTGKGVEQAKTKKDNAGNDLNNAANAAAEGLNSFSTAISGILGGSLKGFADGVVRIIGLISGNAGLAKGLEGLGSKVGGLIGAILQIIDTLGEKPVEFIDDLFDKLSNVVEAVIGNLPEIIEHAAVGIFNIIGGVFHGIGAWFGGGLPDNIDEFEALKESVDALASSNDNLASSVDMLTDAIDAGSVLKAVELAQIQISTLKREEAQNREALLKAASAFKGGEYTDFQNKGSWKADVVLGSDGNLEKIVQAILKSGSTSLNMAPGWYDGMYMENPVNTHATFGYMVSNFTSRDWYTIATELPELWDELIRALEAGDEDASEYLKNTVTYWKQIEDAENRIREKLTNVSFDTIENEFATAIMNMDSTAADFTENFEKYMKSAIINALVVEAFRGKLQEWYETFAYYMEQTGGDLREEDIAYLRSGYDAIVQGALRSRDALSQINGWSSDAAADISELSESFKSALSDMEGGAESWAENVKNHIAEALAEAMVYSDPNFQKWLEDWSRSVQAVIDDDTLGEEERAARLATLREESGEAYEYWAGRVAKANELAGISAQELEESFDSMFDSLMDAITDADTSVWEWARQFRVKLAREFVQASIFTDDDMKVLREAGARIAAGIADGLDPEELQGDFDIIEGYITRGKSLYEALSEGWALTDPESEKLATPFDNMRDSILDALMDVEHGTENFVQRMRELLTRDLIEKMVLTQELDVLDGSMVFNNYDAWQESWLGRYAAAVEAGDEALMAVLQNEAQTVQRALAEMAQRYTEGLKETARDTTFTDMTDSFVSTLMDMDKSAEEWGEEIGRTMAKKIIEKFIVSAQIQPLLDELQEAMNAAMNAEGATSASVLADKGVTSALEAIKARYPELQETVKGIMEALGVTVEKEVEKQADRFSDLESTLLDGIINEETAEDFGRRVAQKLMTAMLEEMVSHKYAERLAEIRRMLDLVLTGGTDENGVGYTIYDVIEAVKDLYGVLTDGSDADLTELAQAIAGIGYAASDAAGELSDLGDAILDNLLDTDATAENFGKDMAQKLIRGMMSELMSEKYGLMIESLQDLWDKVLHSDERDSEGNPLYTLEELLERISDLAGYVADDEDMKKLSDWYATFEKSVDEAAASNPFDNLRSSLVSSLMDMEATTEDFANNIARIMTEAMIDKYVLGQAFDDKLAQWQERYKAIAEDAGMSEGERAAALSALKREVAEYREQRAEEAKQWQDLMGTSEYADQDATVNMADKATYDQFELYLGIAMAQQIAMEQGNAVREQILATLRGMSGLTGGGEDLSEIRELLHAGNGYLWELKESNAKILAEFGQHLVEIKARLGNL